MTAAGEIEIATLPRSEVAERSGGLGGEEPARRRLMLAQTRPNLVEIPAGPDLIRSFSTGQRQLAGGLAQQPLARQLSLGIGQNGVLAGQPVQTKAAMQVHSVNVLGVSGDVQQPR